jgi:8-oxo-dGTP diphosphatase
MTVASPNADHSKIPKIAVGAVVFDDSIPDDKRILLVRRAKPPMAGRWSLPGGKLEFGETIESAIQREIFEESGLRVQVGSLIEIVEVIDSPYHYVILDYVCRRTGGELCPGDDASEAIFIRPSDCPLYEVTPAVARVVQKALTLL